MKEMHSRIRSDGYMQLVVYVIVYEDCVQSTKRKEHFEYPVLQ